MKPMPNLMETELESFGASTVEDFTWKQLLDTDACTMCGRCTSVCPAHATGKPLDPREIVLKTGEVMAATGTPEGEPAHRRRPEITIGPTRCSSASPRGGLGLHHAARPATRSARSTSRSSTRSSTCGATCR
jgi:ferredoxin